MTPKSSPKKPQPQPVRGSRGWFDNPWIWLPTILGLLLMGLFLQSFQPGEVLFANDVTLGQMMAVPNRLPQAFAGTWHTGGWLGMEGVSVAPTVSALLTLILTPIPFLKVYAPLTLLFLGFSAWLYFRQLEFNPWVCVLGGLAAGLNMHFFSIACWGLGSWNIATGMVFLALAILTSKAIPQIWAKGILAGLAIGMNLMEAFDVGAMQCIFIGIFLVWEIWSREGAPSKKIAVAIGTEALVIIFSAFIAVHSIASLVGTQVEGISGTGQDTETKEEHWDFATRWSLPKLESLRIFSPGLFGYRMSSRINQADRSSSYWGTVGRDPRVIHILEAKDAAARDKAFNAFALPPQQRADLASSDPTVRREADRALLTKMESAARYSGSGEYAGVLVSILALFGLANSLRGANSPFSLFHRKLAWFWGAAAAFSLIASWGRYGSVYHLLYQLPFVSTVRNPIKFLHPFHLAWIILAGYGLEALWRRYIQAAAPPVEWSKLAPFEKRWVTVSVAVAAACVAGAIVFNTMKPRLVSYLVSQGFSSQKALPMADFANAEARWFVVLMIASVAGVALAIKRTWTGAGARTAWIVLGVIIVFDLARSDIPWIHYFNYKKEYATNSTVEFLADKPYEHRVIGRIVPKGLGSGLVPPIGPLYDYWQQNDFPYLGIQTMDFAQWPRTPELDDAFIKNFALHGTSLANCDFWPAERLWELTSTRYIFHTATLAAILKNQADGQHGIRVNTFLSVRAKPDVQVLEDAGELTAVPDAHGNCALIEFTNALPRARLYANWESPTNDNAILKRLLEHDFDPQHSVLIAPETPVAQSPADIKTDPGTVEITTFKPKYVKLDADAKSSAVLLLNDRVAPEWKAYVDKKSIPILRCNYLMRGVLLSPGHHTVEFRYKPSLTTFWIGLAAWGVGIATAGFLVWSRRSVTETPAAKPSTPVAPAQTPAPEPQPVMAGEPPRPQRAGKQRKKR